MPKYRTLDIHVKYKDAYIEPNTKVDVPEEDVPIWEELVEMHAAERVDKPAKKAPASKAAPKADAEAPTMPEPKKP